MDELLNSLFAAAIHFSGLPATEARPPIQPLPYQAMLAEICADQDADTPRSRALYSQCRRSHPRQPWACRQQKERLEWRDQCLQQRGLVAAYLIGKHRIVYRQDLDLEDDSDNSFIVHEYVHALQEHQLGSQAFGTCHQVLSSEKQAYDAQQKYLKSRGQLLQVGERLRFVTCNDIR